jgi:hypothetical protein
MGKPLFTITTDDLLFIRDSYLDDLDWWNKKYKENIVIDYPFKYIQFKWNEIKNIEVELKGRGVLDVR